MDPRRGRKLNIAAATGLAAGSVFGLAGTIVTHPQLQATLWAIDSVGLVMATTFANSEIPCSRLYHRYHFSDIHFLS